MFTKTQMSNLQIKLIALLKQLQAGELSCVEFGNRCLTRTQYHTVFRIRLLATLNGRQFMVRRVSAYREDGKASYFTADDNGFAACVYYTLCEVRHYMKPFPHISAQLQARLAQLRALACKDESHLTFYGIDAEDLLKMPIVRLFPLETPGWREDAQTLTLAGVK